ncbi:MAG: hypothetical protein FWD52_00340 [Candidatus Bathyarchaeota archaeon]|nr:hypothetical protein [Candidatus Termiticorpusculum sp.]
MFSPPKPTQQTQLFPTQKKELENTKETIFIENTVKPRRQSLYRGGAKCFRVPSVEQTNLNGGIVPANTKPLPVSVVDKNKPTDFIRKARTRALINGLLDFKSLNQVAVELGVARVTLLRDFHRWAKKHNMAFVETEWMERYQKMKKTNEVVSFNALTNIYRQLIAIQAKVNVNVTNQILSINRAASDTELAKQLAMYQKLVYGTVATETVVEVENFRALNSAQ